MTRPLGLLAFAAACSLVCFTEAMAHDAPALDAPIVGKGGKAIGHVAVRPAGAGILLRIEIDAGGLPSGWHGAHLHAAGDCSDTAEFKSAKGHITSAGHAHGLAQGAGGPEEGDLPNLYVHGDGAAKAEFFVGTVNLGDGPTGLRGPNGASLIIHANEDDHASAPIGNAGARLACAAIK